MPATYGPVVFNDESLYRSFAESLFHLRFYDSTQYPPLYPALLAPAFLFGSRFYEVMLFINVLISSAVVFPAYGIARLHLDRRASLLCAAVIGVLPYHLVFPRSLLSENLYFPLLLTSIYLVLLETDRRRLALDALTGILIGSLYLTRHISLVLIPPLVLAWWLKPLPGTGKTSWKNRAIHLGVVLSAAFITYAPWLLANLHFGNPIKEILGFGIASRTNPEQLTLPRMGTIAAGYLSYFALLAAPVTGIVIAAPFVAVQRGLRSAYGRLVIVVTGCAAAVFVAVVRHSWRAHYNFPEFIKLMGRYPLHFSGLFIIVAFVTLLGTRDRASVTPRAPHRRAVVFGTVAGSAAVLLAWAVIVDRSVIPMVARMSDRGAVDGYRLLLVGAPIMWAALALGAAYAAMYGLGRRRTLEVVMGVTLIAYSLWGADAYMARLRGRQNEALLARRTAMLVGERYPEGVVLTFDEGTVESPDEPERFCRGVRFWGVKARYDSAGDAFVMGSNPVAQVRLSRHSGLRASEQLPGQVDAFATDSHDYRIIDVSRTAPADE